MFMVIIYVVLAIVVYLLKRTKIRRHYIGATICFVLFLTVISVFVNPLCFFVILLGLIFVICIIIVDWFEKFMQRRNGAVGALKCTDFSEALRLLDYFF
jgi:hypothetical protein